MVALPRVTDLFVIGGGPAGLAAAIAARRRGLDVTVADCSTPPIDKACGEGIMPDGLAAAASLGLHLDASLGRTFPGIAFHDGETTVSARFPNGNGLGIRRMALHQAMVDHAIEAGVRLAWGVRVSAIAADSVMAGERRVVTRWIAGADGGSSTVRGWAGLDAAHRVSRRYGFRRHYRVAAWNDHMEIHWGDGCQLYITPVAEREVCVVLISRDAGARLEAALPRFPKVARRLAEAEAVNAERGGVSASRNLKSVWRGNVALIGDASGSVDAITGEGLCLLFQQATALAGAIEAGDLSIYQDEHRRIGRRPRFMAWMMLLMDRRNGLRHRAIRALASSPRLFAQMLAAHVGAVGPVGMAGNGIALGWRMLNFKGI
jgi:menaquinone-9 beta-reductase